MPVDRIVNPVRRQSNERLIRLIDWHWTWGVSGVVTLFRVVPVLAVFERTRPREVGRVPDGIRKDDDPEGRSANPIRGGFAVGIIVGVPVSGYIYDTTGSYELVLILCVVSLLLSATLATIVDPDKYHGSFETEDPRVPTHRGV